MRALIVAVVVASMAPLNAQTNPKPALNTDASIAKRVEDMEREIRILKLQMSGVQNRLPVRGAFVDCNTGQYVQALPNSGYLPFLVSCEKIEPYLE